MLKHKEWKESNDMLLSGKAIKIIGYSDYYGKFTDEANVEIMEAIPHKLDGIYRSNGNYNAVMIIGVPSEYSDETLALLSRMKENIVLDNVEFWRLAMKRHEEFYCPLSVEAHSAS
jgi:hypothetical protein